MVNSDYFTLLKKAEKGDVDAQFYVGGHYYKLREFKKAYSWWLRCSKHNKKLGPLFNIGNLYYNGWGLKQNIKKALYYFNLVIKKDPILYPKENIIYTQLALFLIGKIYFDGIFVKRNKTKGLKYYEQAANRGNINAAYTLSSIYGNKGKSDYDTNKHIYFLKKSAKAGLSIAHAELALFYAKKNKKLFKRHYEGAIKKNKKIIDKLELTSTARDGMINMTSIYKKELIRINKEMKKN